MLLPVFSHSFFLRPLLMPVTPRLPPVPPPLRPNASQRWFFFVLSTCHPPPPSHPIVSRRWCFSFFRHVSRHHHLPRIQTRAGGGFFRRFDMSPTTTTSLTSKREPEVVFFDSFAMSPATTTSLASKCEPEVVFFILSTRLPPPPPPSHPNASRRWFFSTFRHVSRHHHLPHIQTRAGGGVFDAFAMSPTTTTSLASKREPEVVFFDLSTRLPPPPPPSRPNASRRWFFFDVFFYYGWDEGVVFIPHAAPFDFFFFCSQQYVVRS